MRLFLLLFMASAFVLSSWATVYVYQTTMERNRIRNELRKRGIKGYARVINKTKEIERRINQSTNGSQTFHSHHLTMEYNLNYRPEDEPFSSSWKDAFNGVKRLKQVPLPEKKYEFKYNVGSKEYYNSYVGRKVPIIFLSDEAGAVEVLQENGDIKQNSNFFLTYFFATFSMLCLFLFFQYLITGKTI